MHRTYIMEISKAAHKDIPKLCDLLDLLFLQEAEFQPNRVLQTKVLEQIIDSPELGQILVLRDRRVPIGMINILFTISTALGGRVSIFEDIVIETSHRGRGAGSILLQAALDFAKSAGCLRVTLLTDQTNESAKRFYTRHGFTLSGMVPMRFLDFNR